MKYFCLGFWLCLSALSNALPAHNLLIQKLQAIHTLDAQFYQSVSVNGRRSSQSSGHFSLKRPGLLYWDIQKPHAQLMVADGHDVWVYEPKLRQVTKKSQKKGVGGAAGLFVSGQPNLWIARYQVQAQTNGHASVFQLVAKNKNNSLSKVKLAFAGERLEKIEFWDQLGQYSQIKLSNVKVNQGVSPRLFHFSIPKGVDVINLG